MANPTLDIVHIEQLMQDFSVAIMQDDTAFVYSQVFPNVPVSKESDKFEVMDRSYFMRDKAEVRTPGTESAGGHFKIKTDRYQVDEYSYHSFVTNRSIQNQDSPIDLFKGAVMKVKNAIKRKLEDLFKENFMTPGKWTINLKGNTDFTYFDDAGSDPIKVIQEIKAQIHAVTGFKINTMVMTSDVFFKMPMNPTLRELLKYTQVANVGAFSPQALGNILGIEKVIIAEAIEATSEEGQNDIISYVTANRILLAYVPPTVGLDVPASGVTFSHTKYAGNDFGFRIKILEDQHKDGFKVEGGMMCDMKLISPILGALLTDVIKPL